MDTIKLTTLKELSTAERRRINTLVDRADKGEIEVYNREDLGSYLGQMVAIEVHLQRVEGGGDGNFCLEKHIEAAIVFCLECNEDPKPLFSIREILTDGKVKACQQCEYEKQEMIDVSA